MHQDMTQRKATRPSQRRHAAWLLPPVDCAPRVAYDSAKRVGTKNGIDTALCGLAALLVNSDCAKAHAG